MIIGVDAGCLSVENESLKVGIYHASLSLLKNLSKLDKKNKYLLYSFSPFSSKVLAQFGSNMENLVLSPRRFWSSLRLSLEFLLRKPDIFLGLSQALPLFHPLKTIIFVHDLAFEHYPKHYRNSFSKLSRQTRYATFCADKIVAVSQSTKDDLINLYSLDPAKIEVIYHGVDPIFSPQDGKEIKKIRRKYNLKKPFFLFLGSLKPIKNVPSLIEAFAMFLREIKKPYQLVLAGSKYWLDQEIIRRIKKFELSKEVLILGYLPIKDLPAMYSAAFAFVSPSFYEGFGMPILEAMACGTPVVTSDISSMPEVAGNAAILVDPYNIGEIKLALYKMATDKNLHSELRVKALARAKNFSWKIAAQKVLNKFTRLRLHLG